MVTDFYKKLLTILKEEHRLVLMVVIANEGSSPGRKGFKMLVSKHQMFGTIGGGIMEHKLVEYAQRLLAKPKFEPFVKKQVHDKSAPKDQSGMICSGEQSVAFYDIDMDFIPTVAEIILEENCWVLYAKSGIEAVREAPSDQGFFMEKNTLTHKVYIVGGGHVGLALSEVLSRLDFELHLLDHRENLNTMEANNFVQSKQVVNFETIENYIPQGEDIYVVIMSFGYRTDDVIIRRLLGRNYKFIGMLGSEAKIKTLFQNLELDGFDRKQIDSVHAPIGLNIKSETTQEIAISIAAQLIQIRNKHR